MEGDRWKTCPVHGKVCKQYCSECMALFCHKCEGHDDHKICFFKKYVSKNIERLPTSNVFPSLISQVTEKITAINEEGTTAREECEEKEESIKSLNVIVDDPGKTLENDLIILERARTYLSETREMILTPEGKKACKRAIEDLDVDERVREEVESAGQRKDELAREVKERNERIKELCLALLQLEKAKNELEGELDEEGKFLLLMLRDKGALDFENIKMMEIPNNESGDETKYCLNTTIEEFRACNNVERVLDIESVMKQPLEDVGEGIRMSQPINVELGLETGNIRTVNISHNGVVAIYYYSYYNNGNYLQLTNLFTKQQVEFEIENWTTTAFYDDKIIVMTFGQKLREAPINALFTTPNKKTLKVIGDVELGWCSPNTLTQQTRRVYYKSRSHDLYEYNVDTKENSKIETGHRVNSIASLGGIDLGVKCVFKSYDDKKIYALKMDNTVEYVSDGDGSDDGYSLTNVFPSSNTPDLSKALYKMSGNFVYKNRKVNLKCPLEFNDRYTIVRLYKDVFLAYDKGTKAWKLVRISIP